MIVVNDTQLVRSRRPRRRGVALGIAGALLLAACGGGDDDGSAGTDGAATDGGAGEALTVLAYDRLAFDLETYTAPAGEITFTYVNEGVIPHTLVVEGFEDEMKLTVNAAGDEVSGSITLEPGEYVLYCDVPGHRSGGMVSTLVVE